MIACTQYQVVDSNNNIIYEGRFTPDTDNYNEWRSKFINMFNETFKGKFDRNLKMIYRISGNALERHTDKIIYVDVIREGNFTEHSILAAIGRTISSIVVSINVFGYLPAKCKRGAKFINKIGGNE